MADLFDGLSLTDEERTKLRALGVATPLGLLSLRKTSTEAIDSQFGPARAEMIAQQLKAMLTGSELQSLNQPLRQGGRLGARLK